jgi:hypothetical protein
MINSPLRVSNPRRVDGQDRSAPASDILVRPNFPDLVSSPLSDVLVHCRSVGQDTLQHDEATRVIVESRVLPPGGVQALVNGVQSIDLWRFGEVFRNCGPMSGDRLTKLLFPLASYIKAISPIGNFIGKIEGLLWWSVLSDSIRSREKVSLERRLPILTVLTVGQGHNSRRTRCTKHRTPYNWQ